MVYKCLETPLTTLVGGLKHVLFSHSVGNVIIPIDEIIFFRWVAIPPISYSETINHSDNFSHSPTEAPSLAPGASRKDCCWGGATPAAGCFAGGCAVAKPLQDEVSRRFNGRKSVDKTGKP